MSIQRVAQSTEISEGQWICREALLLHSPCAKARKVIKVSGQRVYFANRQGENDGDYCLRKSVVFVCDTQAEGAAVFAISEAQREATYAAIRAVTEKHTAMIDALIASKIPA